MAYPIAPTQLIGSFGNPINRNATPLNQRIKGGVEQNSIAGEINVVKISRTLIFWVKTADYGTVSTFFDGLNGRPFLYEGVAYRSQGENWKVNSAALWELSISVAQVFNPG